MSDKTTIMIEKKTRDRLKSLGKKGEDYNSIILKLMDIGEERVLDG